MEVTYVKSVSVAVPLAEPVSFSNRTLMYRDYAIMYVQTESKHEGVDYSLGYEGAELIAEAVKSLLAVTTTQENIR